MPETSFVSVQFCRGSIWSKKLAINLEKYSILKNDILRMQERGGNMQQTNAFEKRALVSKCATSYIPCQFKFLVCSSIYKKNKKTVNWQNIRCITEKKDRFTSLPKTQGKKWLNFLYVGRTLRTKVHLNIVLPRLAAQNAPSIRKIKWVTYILTKKLHYAIVYS